MTAIAHSNELDIWTGIAGAVRPRPLVPPSDWAESNVILSIEQSESRPGSFSCGWKPWTKAIHDVMHNEPHKAGVVCMKPARVGFTRAVINMIGCICETRPGNVLYLINNKDQASYWATEHFDPLIGQVPALKRVFTVDEGRRETTIQRPYNGGRVDFSGAGTVSGVISRGYVYVFLDEYDTILDEFPVRKVGSPWGMAEGRVKEARDRSQIWTWSHPRKAGEGVHELYTRISDRRAWVFDCPHCGETIRPDSSQIHMETTDAGDLDPSTAAFVCPHCASVIDDHDRRREVWPAELGGSGRFESELEDDDARARKYVGLAINGLADPFVTVHELASGKALASSEADLQAWCNITMGEPYTPASAVITVDVVKERILAMEQIAVPGGADGCVLVTCGGDIQAPEKNPTIYLRTTAWTAHGHAFCLYDKLSGWNALSEFLSRLAVPVAVGEGVEPYSLVPQVCTLDCGAFTRQVLDFCRENVLSVHNNQRIELLPVRYQAHVKSTEPAIMPPEKKRIDPMRPYLGPQTRYDLHRHSWLDREMRRWTDGRITVIGTVPDDLPSHITANVLEPVKDVHGWGSPDLVWSKIKGRRDDWAMAGAYDEAGAVLLKQLDRLHEIVNQAGVRRKEGQAPRAGWLEKGRRRERWW